MADERDPKVSSRYRELGADEPPRALDETILAASRRAVGSRPAPLVAPAGRRRWYFPVAAAAIITLAVAVTIQVERQRPDDEFFAQAPPPVSAPAPAEAKEELPLKQERALKAAPKPVSPPRGFTPDPQPAASAPQSADALRDLAKSGEKAAAAESNRSSEAPAQPQARSDAVAETRRMESELQVQRDQGSREGASVRGRISAAPAPQAAPPATAAARPAPAPAPRAVEAPAPQAKPAPDAALGAIASRLVVNPERWLEQIVELRKEGKHEDADKLLAEFRKTYPDYRISDEMRAKVEKRQ
jgi:hypothetical protein